VSEPRVLCVGGATVDRIYRALHSLERDTSNPVTSEQSPGGVARNVAENLARLGVETGFVSLVGNDENGRFVLENLEALGIDVTGVARTQAHSTAEYVAVLGPDGTLALGLSDMAIFDAVTPDIVAALGQGRPDWIFADSNLPASVLECVVAWTRSRDGRLAVDGVSTAKVRRLPRDLSGIDLLFINEAEAAACVGEPVSADAAVDRLKGRGAGAVVVTLGTRGLVVADASGTQRLPAWPCAVRDVTGAGDALVAATLARLLAGDTLARAARAGALAAALTVEVQGSVRQDLSPDLLARELLSLEGGERGMQQTPPMQPVTG
jgi:pseudouridine kinase